MNLLCDFINLANENIENIVRSGSSSPPDENVNETFYNKSTSFFDNISCEALEKTEGSVFFILLKIDLC